MGYTITEDSEAAYLESQADYSDEIAEEELERWLYAATRRYDDAKRAKTGTTIRCPTCGRLHVKTTYNKIFCSNQKTVKRGPLSCKDAYWNRVDEDKRSYRPHEGKRSYRPHKEIRAIMM